MSAEEKSKLPIIKFGKVTNIKYEEPKDFINSISYKAYKQAFDITQEIINDNKTYKDNLSKSERVSGTDIRNAEQNCNIIFFTGDRGTGKTSIMLSYMEFLKDYFRKYSRNKENTLPGMTFEDGNYMFTGLEYFDASSLDNKESILGSILANMLKKWEVEEKRSFGNHGIRREEDYAYKKRKIQKRFNEVYKYLKNLRSPKDIMDEDSDMFMETLENMSMTWNLKQAFQQLVSEYLDIMEYPNTEGAVNSTNHFLVISIDDLDLNIKNGFSLLDEVRKYLMIPNIIVLLSANYEQLEKVCINHYSSEFKDIKEGWGIPKHVKRLSREYVEKIMPSSRQVKLYSREKWDFFEEKEATFKYSCNIVEKDKTIKEKSVAFDGTLEGLIKNNMKEYLDVDILLDGRILYYLTPSTLRELVEWVKQISTLKKSEEGIKIDLQYYNQNLKWFWNERFPWIIKKHLELEDQGIFSEMDTLEPFHQIRLAKKRLVTKYKDIKYYSSLLQILGSLNQGFSEEQEKSSIYLLYFTMKVSEIVKLMHCQEEGNRDRYLKKLMQYYNNGIWGTWEKYMVKPLIDAQGARAQRSINRISYIDFSRDNDCLRIDLNGSYDEKDGQDIDRFIEDNKDTLINYQYMLLFFKLNIDNGQWEKNIWTVESDKEEKNNNKTKITRIKLQENYGGLFCLSNVVINLLEGAKLIEKFVDDFSRILSVGQTQNKIDARKIKRKISVLELKDELRTWNGKELLPIENLEYLINLGTELQDNAESGSGGVLRDTIIRTQVNIYFSIIHKSLLCYFKEYGEKFDKFPPIAKILKNDDKFMSMLVNSILSIPMIDMADIDETDWSI